MENPIEALDKEVISTLGDVEWNHQYSSWVYQNTHTEKTMADEALSKQMTLVKIKESLTQQNEQKNC